MSNLYLPTLPGLVLKSRTLVYDTTVQRSVAGNELRIKRRAPGYRYTFEARWLRSQLGEHTTLTNHMEAHSGSYESFLYLDPYDGVTKRVRFLNDEIPLEREKGGVFWSCSFELQSVI